MYSNINKIDFTRARRTSLSFTSQRCPTLRSLLHFDELGLELGYAGCLLRPLVVVRPVAFAEVDVLEGGARIALLVRLPSPGSPAGGGEIEKLVRACKISGFPIHQVWNKKLNHHICRLRDEIHIVCGSTVFKSQMAPGMASWKDSTTFGYDPITRANWLDTSFNVVQVQYHLTRFVAKTPPVRFPCSPSQPLSSTS